MLEVEELVLLGLRSDRVEFRYSFYGRYSTRLRIEANGLKEGYNRLEQTKAHPTNVTTPPIVCLLRSFHVPHEYPEASNCYSYTYITSILHPLSLLPLQEITSNLLPKTYLSHTSNPQPSSS